MIAASNTNLFTIDFEYMDIQEPTLWKHMLELANDMPNSNAITQSQNKKLNTNKLKNAMEKDNKPMGKSTKKDTSGTFIPAVINLDIQDKEY